MANRTSQSLPMFTAKWESPGGRPVKKAYRCPAGVITIGHGATDRSPTFRKFWMAKRGHRLRMGDTITEAEANQALDLMLRNDYSPPVARALPDTVSQQAFDAATDMSYNCGPGSLKWRWAKALAAGNLSQAAKLLKVTATTANGRKLKGLVRRRAEEANLMLYGYSAVSIAEKVNVGRGMGKSHAETQQYQGWLKTLGYYSGEIDGINGPLTEGAVKNFQRKHGLTIDGIVGPATTATLIRALDARKTTQTTTGGATVGGAGGAAVAPTSEAPPAPVEGALPDLSVSSDMVWSVVGYGVAAAVVIFIGFMIYRNRGRIFGKRVPT